MSLDVYLHTKETHIHNGSGIFVRLDGQTKEISREEWDKLSPGKEPLSVPQPLESNEVFSRNITHNLGLMAKRADLYLPLWCPEEMGIEVAWQLIELLRDGLRSLMADPAYYRELNPSNGWGSYELLVDFVRCYLQACRQYPDAEVFVSR